MTAALTQYPTPWTADTRARIYAADGTFVCETTPDAAELIIDSVNLTGAILSPEPSQT
jgi:hypothetical protein